MYDNKLSVLFTSLTTVMVICIDLSANIIITEIMPNPVINGEWIEIYNSSADQISLESWSLVDLAENIGLLPNLPIIISGNEFAILAKDSITITELNLMPHQLAIILKTWAGLNNDGDKLTLRNSAGIEVDQMSYGTDAAKIKGKSWERINLESIDSNSSNWGQCASLRGHTAGETNSLYITNQSKNIKIFADPNPFSPDGDGYDDILTISFELPFSKSRISASVYNLDGHMVCQLASDLSAGPSLPILQWSGKTNNGKTLPVGRYIIFLESLDYQTGTVLSGKKVIVLAGKK